MSAAARILAFFLVACPLWLLHGLGAPLGWLTWALSPTYRRRLHANAARAGVAPAEARRSVAQAGRMVAELPKLWLRPADRPLGGLTRWAGAEHIEQALAAGRGVVFLTPHLGCFEVAAQFYAQDFGARSPITVLYRPARQAVLRRWVEASRQRPGLLTAPASLQGVRQLLRALKQGGTVGLLPDQVPPEGLGVWAPFFGQPAYTMTLAARLAQQTGATVLLAWGERLSWGRGYVVHVEPLPGGEAEALAGADPAQSAALINRAMERLILRCPSQYLWGYNRYKQPRSLPASTPDAAVAGRPEA